MARASYIYIVLRNGMIHRAYTVKHECKTFLGQQPEDELILMQVVRMRDGGDMNTRWRWSAYMFLKEV